MLCVRVLRALLPAFSSMCAYNHSAVPMPQQDWPAHMVVSAAEVGAPFPCLFGPDLGPLLRAPGDGGCHLVPPVGVRACILAL
eukprot:2249978-Alexandrium_andersonii.AAC.1